MILAIYNFQKFGLNPQTSHPPLFSWINIGFASVMGDELWKFRTMMIFFGLLTLYLSFWLSKRIYSDNLSAILTIVIAGFSFYHVLASLQLGAENIITFFYLFFFLLYFRYQSRPSKFLLILMGLVFGVSLLIKINSVLILLITGLFELVTQIKNCSFALL